MQTRILWKGLDTPSMEHCYIALYESGPEVQATVMGVYGNAIYKTEYRIQCNAHWHTIAVDISCHFEDILSEHQLRSDGEGNWLVDGKDAPLLKGCLDVDISQTPFSNSLLINRARLPVGTELETNIIYLDVLQRELNVKKQKYTRISEQQYRFANVPNDFEALISVDDDGIVREYEGLFTRIIKN